MMSPPGLAINLSSILRRNCPRNILHTTSRTHAKRSIRTNVIAKSPSEHRVTLDNQTLYIDQKLAEALGWKPVQGSDASVQLSLRGWGPTYFTIAPTGSESDRLAHAVVESSCNPKVKKVLDYLKDR